MEDLMRNASLHDISIRQHQAGDAAAAIKTLQEVPLGIYQVTTLRELTINAARKGQPDEARRFVKFLLSHDDGTLPPAEQAGLLAIAAGSYLEIPDPAAARSCLQRALQVSQEAEQAAHPLIAVNQIKAGLPEEAYQTVQQIKSVGERAWPLAVLAETIARREAEKPSK
jgi:hypothetical protein